ncbi:hypothetical protein ACSU6B_12835 [Neobacillus sp. C211]|uniref:hypothetical protein n=1 Tax=unclassified Neobacillus TaxID=2675272 RepID=UPI00397D97D7
MMQFMRMLSEELGLSCPYEAFMRTNFRCIGPFLSSWGLHADKFPMYRTILVLMGPSCGQI